MKKVLIASALAATCLNAYAEGGYVGVGFGQGSISFEPVNIAGVSVTEDDKGTSYKIFGGYEFNKYFAAELGYQEFGSFSQTLTFGASVGKAELKGHGFFLDLVGKLPLSEAFSLFAKIGLAQTTVDATYTLTGIFVGCCSNTSASETDPRFGLGAQYNFNRQVGARLEYERTKNVGNPDTTGEGDIDYLGIALTYMF